MSAVVNLFPSMGCHTCTCRREHPRLAKDSLGKDVSCGKLWYGTLVEALFNVRSLAKIVP